MSELTDIIDRHCRAELVESVVPRLTLARAEAATVPGWVSTQPRFCFVARGRKRVWLGEQEFVYDPSTYLVTSTEVTVSAQVMEAPYLGFTLTLHAPLIAEILLALPKTTAPRMAAKAIAVARPDADLLDAVLRLVRLLDRPQHIPVLAPMIEREILYHLLLGPLGETLRQFGAPASPLSQIRQAIDWIQQNYHEPLRIEQVARMTGMSPASLHRHFRAVTNQSPLQFQKRIRLTEARRRLLTEHADAASVAFDVGYESPSQFSREYRRLFGAPPARHVGELRRQMVVVG